jgi:hypothetical protein
MRSRLGIIVGIRRLHQVGLRQKVVIVKLGKPKKEKVGDWACPFTISGLGIHKIEYGHGIDAIQALLMAIEGIRARLEQSGKRFVWAGGESGDTGFTRFVPTFFGLDFSKRLDRLIDREVKRFARTAETRYRKRHQGSRK